jgi:alkylated DNA repair protein (DNA oxidative demethylase)
MQPSRPPRRPAQAGKTLVFGRQARFACHDEPRIYPGTGHPRSGLTRGRINITMRMTVLGGYADQAGL